MKTSVRKSRLQLIFSWSSSFQLAQLKSQVEAQNTPGKPKNIWRLILLPKNLPGTQQKDSPSGPLSNSSEGKFNISSSAFQPANSYIWGYSKEKLTKRWNGATCRGPLASRCVSEHLILFYQHRNTRKTDIKSCITTEKRSFSLITFKKEGRTFYFIKQKWHYAVLWGRVIFFFIPAM